MNYLKGCELSRSRRLLFPDLPRTPHPVPSSCGPVVFWGDELHAVREQIVHNPIIIHFINYAKEWLNKRDEEFLSIDDRFFSCWSTICDVLDTDGKCTTCVSCTKFETVYMCVAIAMERINVATQHVFLQTPSDASIVESGRAALFAKRALAERKTWKNAHELKGEQFVEINENFLKALDLLCTSCWQFATLKKGRDENRVNKGILQCLFEQVAHACSESTVVYMKCQLKEVRTFPIP